MDAIRSMYASSDEDEPEPSQKMQRDPLPSMPSVKKEHSTEPYNAMLLTKTAQPSMSATLASQERRATSMPDTKQEYPPTLMYFPQQQHRSATTSLSSPKQEHADFPMPLFKQEDSSPRVHQDEELASVSKSYVAQERPTATSPSLGQEGSNALPLAPLEPCQSDSSSSEEEEDDDDDDESSLTDLTSSHDEWQSDGESSSSDEYESDDDDEPARKRKKISSAAERPRAIQYSKIISSAGQGGSKIISSAGQGGSNDDSKDDDIVWVRTVMHSSGSPLNGRQQSAASAEAGPSRSPMPVADIPRADDSDVDSPFDGCDEASDDDEDNKVSALSAKQRKRIEQARERRERQNQARVGSKRARAPGSKRRLLQKSVVQVPAGTVGQVSWLVETNRCCVHAPDCPYKSPTVKKRSMRYKVQRHYERHGYVFPKYMLPRYSWVKPEFQLPEEDYEVAGLFFSRAFPTEITQARDAAALNFERQVRTRLVDPESVDVEQLLLEATDAWKQNQGWQHWCLLGKDDKEEWRIRLKERQKDQRARIQRKKLKNTRTDERLSDGC